MSYSTVKEQALGAGHAAVTSNSHVSKAHAHSLSGHSVSSACRVHYASSACRVHFGIRNLHYTQIQGYLLWTYILSIADSVLNIDTGKQHIISRIVHALPASTGLASPLGSHNLIPGDVHRSQYPTQPTQHKCHEKSRILSPMQLSTHLHNNVWVALSETTTCACCAPGPGVQREESNALRNALQGLNVVQGK